MSEAATPPGALAVARYRDLEATNLLQRVGSLIVVVAGIRDPGNLGTILRTAWAAGADSLFLGQGTVDVYNAKVVRSSAGALFNLPFARDVELPWLLTELGAKKMHRIAADPRGSIAYHELSLGDPCALIFGGEARGIPNEIESLVDSRARVPMPGGAESLNVAITAALFLFEAARQRRR
jgi:TrmH family RNA methyltransferase